MAASLAKHDPETNDMLAETVVGDSSSLTVPSCLPSHQETRHFMVLYFTCGVSLSSSTAVKKRGDKSNQFILACFSLGFGVERGVGRGGWRLSGWRGVGEAKERYWASDCGRHRKQLLHGSPYKK